MIAIAMLLIFQAGIADKPAPQKPRCKDCLIGDMVTDTPKSGISAECVGFGGTRDCNLYVVTLPDGRTLTIKQSGTYSISGPEGEYKFTPAPQDDGEAKRAELCKDVKPGAGYLPAEGDAGVCWPEATGQTFTESHICATCLTKEPSLSDESTVVTRICVVFLGQDRTRPCTQKEASTPTSWMAGEINVDYREALPESKPPIGCDVLTLQGCEYLFKKGR